MRNAEGENERKRKKDKVIDREKESLRERKRERKVTSRGVTDLTYDAFNPVQTLLPVQPLVHSQ